MIVHGANNRYLEVASSILARDIFSLPFFLTLHAHFLYYGDILCLLAESSN